MATRPLLAPMTVIDAGNMAGNLTSLVTVLSSLSTLSYSLSWSGTTPVGTVSVQLSNDYTQGADGKTLNAGTWNTMVFEYGGSPVSTVPVSGNTGNGLLDIRITGGYAIRLIYTAGSGTGSITAKIFAKVT